jgi:hypothetical protein
VNKIIIVALISFFIIPLSGYSQFRRDRNPIKTTEKKLVVGKSYKTQQVNDSIQIADTINGELPSVKIKKKPHSPHKATIYAMILPGLGQIYNRQWWKVPILYGGITATYLAIDWNGDMYRKYKGAFVDYVQLLNSEQGQGDPPATQRWKEIFLQDVSEFTDTQKEWFKNTLKNKKDSFKRDRDMMYIVMAGIYVLNIIDASVFAHFYDFDISDDLSMGIKPTMQHSTVAGNSVGVSCTIRF